MQQVKRSERILGGLLIIGLLLRLPLLHWVKYPGWGDYAFYYTVARNLAMGRGFIIDYIWHFLYLPPQVTHYSNDYWMPMTSIVMAIPMSILGSSLQVGAFTSAGVGTLLGCLAYWLAREHGRSSFVALSAAAYTLVFTPLLTYSLLTDTPVYYAFFAGLAFLFLSRSARHPASYRPLLLAGVLVGFTHLTRQDGVLLIILLLFIAGVYGERARVRRVGVALLAYGITLLPWLVLNQIYLGHPWTSGTMRTLFFRSYADMYAYKRVIDWHYYLSWGWGNILRSKLHAFLFNAHTFYSYLPFFMWALIVVGGIMGIQQWIHRERRIPHLYIWPFCHGFLLYVFYTLFFTFPGIQGGFLRSSMFLLPFLAIFVAETIERYITPPRAARIFVVVTFLFMAYYGVRAAHRMVLSNARAGEGIARIIPLLEEEQNRGQEVVLMTIAPWEFHAVTGVKTVQIPTEDREAIYELALRYGVTHLVLPGKRDRFDALYRGEETDPRFLFWRRVPDSPMKLYRLRSSSGER